MVQAIDWEKRVGMMGVGVGCNLRCIPRCIARGSPGWHEQAQGWARLSDRLSTRYRAYNRQEFL